MNNAKKILIGAKYGILAIVISFFATPFLYYFSTFLREVMKAPDNVFRPIFIIWEIYLGAMITIPVFFFLPYSVGGCILGLLIANRKTTSPGQLGMIVGLVSGIGGLLLMASWIWQVKSYRTIDWPTVGVAVVWSVAIFVAIAYRLKKIFTDKDLQ